MKIIYLFIVALVFTQCDSKPVGQDYNWDGKEKYLQQVVVLKFDSCAALDICGDLVLLEPDLMIIPQIRRPEFLTAYKLSNDSLLYQNLIIRKGEGPNEMRGCPDIAQLNNGKYVLMSGDWSPKVFYSDTGSKESLTDLTAWGKHKLPYSICISSIAPELNSPNKFYGTMYGDSTMFFQYTLNDSVLTPILCDYPEAGLEIPNRTDLSYLYRGCLLKHPTRDIYFYSCYGGKYSYTFNIVNKRVNILHRFYNDPPKFTLKEGVFGFTADPNNPDGPSCVVDDNYIYMLDRSHSSLAKKQKREMFESKYFISDSRTIYVFDWDGNPVKKLILDRPVSSFTIDKEGNIYALTIDPDEEDQFILKYLSK